MKVLNESARVPTGWNESTSLSKPFWFFSLFSSLVQPARPPLHYTTRRQVRVARAAVEARRAVVVAAGEHRHAAPGRAVQA